jgi:periplasmic divalent cation tolerance protein
MIIVYITCKNSAEAKKIGSFLVEKRLAACANYFPVNSIYEWKNKMVKDNEVVLLLKTINKNFNKIKKEVKRLHSYEVPCILKIKVDANKEYNKWVEESTK